MLYYSRKNEANALYCSTDYMICAISCRMSPLQTCMHMHAHTHRHTDTHTHAHTHTCACTCHHTFTNTKEKQNWKQPKTDLTWKGVGGGAQLVHRTYILMKINILSRSSNSNTHRETETALAYIFQHPHPLWYPFMTICFEKLAALWEEENANIYGNVTE